VKITGIGGRDFSPAKIFDNRTILLLSKSKVINIIQIKIGKKLAFILKILTISVFKCVREDGMFGREITNHLWQILHGRSDSMWIGIDRGFRIIYANEAFLQHCRKPLSALIGKSMLDVFYGGRKRDRYGRYYGPLIETMDTGKELHNVEAYLPGAPQNTMRWLLVSTYLIRDKQGRPLYAFGNYTSIDKFKALERYTDKLRLSIIMTIVKAIGSRDSYTMHHSDHVADLMTGLAWYMHLSEEEIRQAYIMGIIHDVGKIGIPEQILSKPGKLTAEEYLIIQNHPVLGAEIIEPISDFASLAAAVRGHHERYDGRGYPDKLAGEDIPLFSRMLAVCDSFDAMTTNRCYRSAVSIDEALEEIERCAGTQFDPGIAELFIAYINQYGNPNNHNA